MSLVGVIAEFAERIQSMLEAGAKERAQATILTAFGIGDSKKPGRPAKAIATVSPRLATSTRRKLPPQYCPVPYCRDLAAPIFGMVCAKHKDVPKAKIKKYREERRAKKDGVKLPTRTKRSAVARKTPTKAKVTPKKKTPKRAAKKVPGTRPSKKASKPTVTTPVVAAAAS